MTRYEHGIAVLVVHASAWPVQSRRLPTLASACPDGLAMSEALGDHPIDKQATIQALRTLASFLESH